MNYIPANLIKKKRDGHALSKEEIQFFVNGFYKQSIPDYQMSALLMAITLRGLNKQEAADLTQAMLHSGKVLNFSNLPYLPVDKHSTGGVGDKTSLLIAPIVSACGVPVPMIAGRGLGHTGGTLDKLESIPGYNTQLSLTDFEKQVRLLSGSIIGQTQEICPADKKMYALRDVTATVESIGLICGSILSKKIAEGIKGLVMDVKCGSGAFMKTQENAEELALWLSETASLSGVKTISYITQMSEPLGLFIGNSIEVLECLSILKNEPVLGYSPSSFNDTRELSLILAGEMLYLSGRSTTSQQGYILAEETLESGAALKQFEKIVTAQSGRLNDFSFPTNLSWCDVISAESGYLESYDTEAIGYAAISLGAGRKISTDQIDFNASIIAPKKIGDPIKKGDVIFRFTQKSAVADKSAMQYLDSSFKISLQKTKRPSLILNKIGG